MFSVSIVVSSSKWYSPDDRRHQCKANFREPNFYSEVFCSHRHWRHHCHSLDLSKQKCRRKCWILTRVFVQCSCVCLFRANESRNRELIRSELTSTATATTQCRLTWLLPMPPLRMRENTDAMLSMVTIAFSTLPSESSFSVITSNSSFIR